MDSFRVAVSVRVNPRAIAIDSAMLGTKRSEEISPRLMIVAASTNLSGCLAIKRLTTYLP